MITSPSTALSGTDWPVSKSKTTVEGLDNLVFAGAESAAWSARAESAEAAYFLWAKNQLLELLIHAEVA